MRRKLVITALLLFPLSITQAQVLFSNGAQVSVSTGATVHVNGGVEISNSSSFTNQGDVTSTKNSTLPSPGNFRLSNSAVVSGNGTYRVEQDWINNATFNAGSSTVQLFGNTQQFITSTNGTVTTFNILLLDGTGIGNNRKKTLQSVDAGVSVTGALLINDRELETQTQTFSVLNPAANSVTNSTFAGSEGFVSSVAPGVLSRVTNSTGTYVFPTGSSTGTLRYRPVEIIPANLSANTYTVRLNNYDPNIDGFARATNDGLECDLNDLYYHSILRPAGTAPSDIRLFYIPATDGNWDGMAHWRTTNNQWNDMNTTVAGTATAFLTLTRPTWNFTNPGHPYVLTNIRPAQPSIVCPSICENTSNNTFTLTGSATSYQWTVPANGNITSGQGTNSIDVNWTTGSGYVYVYAVGTAGCNSLPDSCLPTVLVPPVADFSSVVTGDFDDTYTFTDLSTGATSWAWNFGDGGNSSQQNPVYQYLGGGNYLIVLTVSNGACSDTAQLSIIVGEGFMIPNVFSPNGDGFNDAFHIQSSGLKEYSITIYDRWGLTLFNSEDATEAWKGTTLKGDDCPDGTYFYTLKALSATKDYSTHGTVTLFRNKKE